MADVRTIAFTRVIKDKLFAGNEFVRNSTSHDSEVNNDKVQIPGSGTISAIEEDRSSYPITVETRTDDRVEYDLIEFSTPLIRIPEKDRVELSYDKTASVLRQFTNKLADSVALRALYNWAEAAPQVETTGTAAAGIAPPGGTGNRQPLELVDLANAAAILDGQNVSQMGRYLIVPSLVYWNFVNNNKAQLLNLDYNRTLTNEDIASGIVAKVYGWNIVPRSYTVVYDNTDALKAVGAATAATDQWGMVGFQMDEVCRALGSIKIYSQLNAPEYQADLYSATIRFGSAKMRSDGVGVVTIRQDT